MHSPAHSPYPTHPNNPTIPDPPLKLNPILTATFKPSLNPITVLWHQMPQPVCPHFVSRISSWGCSDKNTHTMNRACCPPFRHVCWVAEHKRCDLFFSGNKQSLRSLCVRDEAVLCVLLAEWALDYLLWAHWSDVGGGEMRSPFVVYAGSGGDNGSRRVISRPRFSSGLKWAAHRRRARLSVSQTWSSCLLLSSTLIWLKSSFIKAGEAETHSALISGMVLQTWLTWTWPVFLSADTDERITVAELFVHLWSAWISRSAGSYWL